MRKIGIALLLLLAGNASARLPYKYRVVLTDKQQNSSLLATPELLLSEGALARRLHHEVAVDTTDLPVSANYIAQLAQAGFPWVCSSRWMNSVVVEAPDTTVASALKAFPFVKEVRLVWKENGVQPSFFVKEDTLPVQKRQQTIPELPQLTVHQGELLHQAGYRGEGMTIAVIDAGFLNADKIPFLQDRIAGARDFVNPELDIFATHPHGLNVMSVMATPLMDNFSGTAPAASYWLLRTEDSASEYPVEEDYWVAAAEYADSLGVNVINSSLGYTLFDDPAMNYHVDDLNGKTAFISRGASMAASKGILVVNSAGNEGQKPWRMITFPADSPDVLTVGAVTPDMQVAGFSSHGFISKGYVKPDIAGVGSPSYYIDHTGAIATGSGTSFSTPAVTGLAACLWQALPQLKNKDIKRLLQTCSTFASYPDSLRGYGIPNVYRAFAENTPLRQVSHENLLLVPIDSLGSWQLTGLSETETEGVLRVFNIAGRLIDQYPFRDAAAVFDLTHLEKGLYILDVQATAFRFSQRIHLKGL